MALKQQKIIFSQFQEQGHKPKIHVLARYDSLSGESWYSLIFVGIQMHDSKICFHFHQAFFSVSLYILSIFKIKTAISEFMRYLTLYSFILTNRIYKDYTRLEFEILSEYAFQGSGIPFKPLQPHVCYLQQHG